MGSLRAVLLTVTLFCLSTAEEAAHPNQGNEAPRVQTQYGEIVGMAHGVSDVFLGIPYAQPPMGELRFEKPVAPDAWDYPFEATGFASACVPHAKDAIHSSAPVSEDCLYLNVIRPERKEGDALLPVLFYIHGGGYEIGSAALYGYKCDPKNEASGVWAFAKDYAPHGVIVVSIQYRLGVYGFASLGDVDGFRGNYGLFDQAAALNWTHTNIEAFGGDPSRITVWGISAGGASASQLSLSPLTRHMVAGSIEMSGVAYASWANENRVEKHTAALADAVGCGGEKRTSADVKACLKKKSVDEIFEGVEQVEPSDFSINFIKWGPRIDGEFAPAPYEELAKSAPKIPILLGVHTHEAAYFTLWNRAPTIHRMAIDANGHQYFGRKVFEKYIRMFFREFLPEDEVEAAVELTINFYVGPPKGEEKTTMPDYDRLDKEAGFHLEQYSHFWSDLLFTVAARARALDAKARGQNVYLYLFKHYSKELFNEFDRFQGSFHVNEVPYLMDLQVLKPFKWTDAELKMKDRAHQMMISFVKNGKPTVDNVVWPDLSVPDPTGTPFVVMKMPKWELFSGFYQKIGTFWLETMQQFSWDFVRMRPTERVQQHQIPAPPTVKDHEEL